MVLKLKPAATTVVTLHQDVPKAPVIHTPKPRISLEGFTTADKIDTGGYVVQGHGIEGSGKSRFGLTMPKPLAIICMDMKTMRLIQKEIEEGNYDPSQILVTRNLSRQEGLESTKMSSKSSAEVENDPELRASMQMYRKHVEGTKELMYRVGKHPDIRSVMVDSGTVFFEDVQYANYGRTTQIDPKMRGAANREFMDILQLVSNGRTKDKRRKHLYLTARSTAVWVGQEATDDTKAEGCTKMGYFVQDSIELMAVPSNLLERNILLSKLEVKTRGTDRQITKSSKIGYILHIRRSLRRPSIAGVNGLARLLDDEITYPNLMRMIYTDVDPGEFE